MRERFPEAWERLTTKPHFLFLRLRHSTDTLTGS
jgi:hypothetical protein